MKNTSKIVDYQKKVYIYYSNKGKVVRIATGVSVNEKNIRENKDFVDRVKDNLDKILQDYKKENYVFPSTDYIKGKLGIIKEEKTGMEIMDLLDLFIEEKKRSIQPDSVKKWSMTFKTILQDLSNEYEIDINNIDNDFLYAFSKSLTKRIYQGKPLKDNYILVLFTKMKSFLNFLKEGKYIKESINESTWKNYKLKFVKQKRNFESLTLDELTFLLSKWNTEQDPRWRKTLSMILWQSFTSMRYSDMIRMNKKYIVGDRIKMFNQKTKTEINIDYTDILKEIFKENNFNLCHYKTSLYDNNIKLLLKHYSPDCPSFKENKTDIKFISGGKEKIEVVPRYSLFGSHSFRRTFITLQYEAGASLNLIKQYTGHMDIKTTMSYITNSHNEGSNLSSKLYKKITEPNDQLQPVP